MHKRIFLQLYSLLFVLFLEMVKDRNAFSLNFTKLPMLTAN